MTDANPAPFGARTAILLSVAGALLLLGFLLLSGFGQEINARASRVPGPSAKGATGFQALHDLLTRIPGTTVTMVRSSDGYDTDALMVLTPDRSVKPADLGEIIRRRDGQPTLVILPKWQTERDGLSSTRERRFGYSTWRSIALLEKVAQVGQGGSFNVRRPRSIAGLPDFAPVERPTTITGDAIEPMVAIAGKNGGALLAKVEGSHTWILADPDLANNYGMRDARNAVGMVAALRAMDTYETGEVAFDLTLHYRPGDRNLIKLMFTPPFLAVTIALIAAAALAGWASIARFGPPVRDGRALAFGKAALLDTIAALTRAAGKAGAGGSHYADTMRDWAGHRLRAPGHLRTHALTAWIEEQRPGFAERDGRLRRATDEPELLAAAQGLHDWKEKA